MKKQLSLVIVLVIYISLFSGCGSTGNIPDKDSSVSLSLSSDNIARVTVDSLPQGNSYSFTGADGNAVVEYFNGLTLASNFSEKPEEYSGLTRVVTVEYENGNKVTIYHFGNIFVRADNGPWYKMDYEEAASFEALLDKLNN